MKKIYQILKNAFSAPCVFAANSLTQGVHPEGAITYPAGGSIVAGALVTFDSSGDIVTCGATDVPIGVAADDVSDGQNVTVYLLGNRPGTIACIAGAAISQGAKVYAGESGKLVIDVSAAATYQQVGIALETVTSGKTLEIVHCLPRALVVASAT